jgi:hypothetical protein
VPVLGDGMHHLLIFAPTRYQYAQIWAAVVVISAATTVLVVLIRTGEPVASRQLGLIAER